jgi:hypothetical protein
MAAPRQAFLGIEWSLDGRQRQFAVQFPAIVGTWQVSDPFWSLASGSFKAL